MTITAHSPAPTRPAMDPMRRTSLAAGVLYLITFVSIPTLMLYNPVRDNADFLLGHGSATGVLWGAFSEVVVALAGVGTAVVLFPVAKRQSETAALGFVTSRVLEGALIIVGVVSLLSLVTLRNDVAGTPGVDTSSLLTAGHTQLAVYDSVFLLSQSLMPVFNALCLGYVLYRSRLVPRILPVVGLVGAPLLLAADIAIFFGVTDRAGTIAGFTFIPIAVWEFSLGVNLTVKGFRPSAVAALPPRRRLDPRRRPMSGSPGRARAGGPVRRCATTRSTGCGCPTSLSTTRLRASCTCARSRTCTPTASSATSSATD
jgi:hypothetical protein